MNDRYDAIYARQSIDKKDSISIESQIEFCKYDLKGGDFKEFRDKGYSGKNTARPAFQELMHEIEAGRVRKVLVYKLDRISRSLLDFANMMAVFRQHGVEFVSSTEKFDTSTPVGRAMLHICIVFAQLERETTQMRIADAMYSRSMKGFRLGTTPAGFHLVPYKLNGINTKMLEATEEQKRCFPTARISRREKWNARGCRARSDADTVNALWLPRRTEKGTRIFVALSARTTKTPVKVPEN